MTNPGILNIRKIIRINSAQRETRSTTFSGPNLQGATFLQENDKILTISVPSSLEDLSTIPTNPIFCNPASSERATLFISVYILDPTPSLGFSKFRTVIAT